MKQKIMKTQTTEISRVVKTVETFETYLPVGDIVDIRKNLDGTWTIVQKRETICEEVTSEVKTETDCEEIISEAVIETHCEEIAPEVVIETLCEELAFEEKSSLLKDQFFLVDAKNLSVNDKFMEIKFNHHNVLESNLKNGIEFAINSGVENFWIPQCDPSFDDEGNICFEKGRMPAIGKDFRWWEKNAKAYAPEHGSRLGTESEYLVFLGTIIKKLVEEGCSVEKAWSMVATGGIGDFPKKDADKVYNLTGFNSAVSGFADLGNTCKFTFSNHKNYVVWGRTALATCYHYVNNGAHADKSVGWIVFTK